CQHYYNTPNSF
nr:immunoglobulin light chain junction region [Macaca mulatta]